MEGATSREASDRQNQCHMRGTWILLALAVVAVADGILLGDDHPLAAIGLFLFAFVAAVAAVAGVWQARRVARVQRAVAGTLAFTLLTLLTAWIVFLVLLLLVFIAVCDPGPKCIE